MNSGFDPAHPVPIWKSALPTSGCLLWLLALAFPAGAADLVPAQDFGLRLERGFRLSLYAGNDLAPDTYCMTLDPLGRVVVANGRSIRTLLDENHDGQAEDSVEFAPVQRGVMGMCFVGSSLFVAADGWLERFDDADGDGEADGPPVQLVPLGFGEHGGHAIRQGPDGWLYVMGGNDTGFTPESHATLAGSPVRKSEAGALIRLTPEGNQSEIIAHGFRNPYDFDFNSHGDIFTYDSDCERDAFLPWYTPTRLYQAAYGQHHGWRLGGYQRSWPRPDDYADTVPILSRIGRGSPTGVECYRHHQFPARYRDGLFFADWTFGLIYFFPLEVNGAGYSVLKPEVFLEPLGTQGFAPTDLAVAPDGSLFISIGGRKTRGAVYRVEWTGPRQRLPNAPVIPAPLLNAVPLPGLEVNTVLTAPQPLEAWSRALWMPAAARVGAQPLAAVLTDESAVEEQRVRAIEVLTDLFGGVPAPRAAVAARSGSAAVRARLAWALGRLPGENAALLLAGLALDHDAAVRRNALDAIGDQIELMDAPDLVRITQPNLVHADKFVRLAATRVASLMDDEAWLALTTAIPRASPAVVGASLAQVWRTPDLLVHPEIVGPLTNLLARTRDHATRHDIVRLLILALGDWHLNGPSIEVNSGYEPPTVIAKEFDVPALRRMTRALLPSGDAALDTEAARLLAMLEDDDKRTPVLLASLITAQSTATSDFHYLACIANLRGSVAELAPRLAGAVLNLNGKLAGQEARVKQNWNVRLAEVVQLLARREPAVADALLRHAQFPTPPQVPLATVFEGDYKVEAARRFFAAARANPQFPWTPELLSLLALLPAEDTVPLLRRHWQNPLVRDALVPLIATKPLAVEREKFLSGLGSTQPAVVRASLDALLKLPPDPGGTNLVAPLRLLQRAVREPAESALRSQLLTLITNSLKQSIKVAEPPDPEPAAIVRAYQPVFDYITAKYPGLGRALNAEDNDDPAVWSRILREVPWDRGDAARGAQLFTQRACASCHSDAGAIGPSLAGVAQRFSREDLMSAIVFPSRDIAPPYRTTTFRLRNGESHTGIVAFESADGWLVQTGAGLSVRLDSRDVLARTPATVSVMPSGLLQGLSALALADLYAYLRSLEAR